jgi:hypothetical protein
VPGAVAAAECSARKAAAWPWAVVLVIGMSSAVSVRASCGSAAAAAAASADTVSLAAGCAGCCVTGSVGGCGCRAVEARGGGGPGSRVLRWSRPSGGWYAGGGAGGTPRGGGVRARLAVEAAAAPGRV